MNEFAKTGIAAGVAVLLAAIVALTAPGAPKADDFREQGQLFFPDFKDPLAATSLQVVAYDATASAPAVFKVEFKNGRWTIPSHHDYPADGKERLAKTATSVMGIRKDAVRSSRKEDHAACGVLDPEDSAGGDAASRGKRITLRDASGSALADLIIGKQADDDGKKFFVRIPGQPRIYAVKLDVDISTSFGDWIETDLTLIDPASVWQITLDNYTIEQTGRFIKPSAEVITVFEKARDDWKTDGLAADEEVDVKAIGDITGTIDDLKILGVRKKTPAMIALLKGEEGAGFSDADIGDLVEKGFIPMRGELLSKEGNLIVSCEDGVVYQVRFGAVFTGTGLDLTAGGEKKKDEKKDEKAPGATEARFLMIVAAFDEKGVKPEKMDDPPKNPRRISTRPWSAWRVQQEEEARRAEYDKAMQAHGKLMMEAGQRYQARAEAGKKRAKQLSDRFAEWYYVIGADSFAKLHVKREDVVKSKNKPAGPELPPDDGHEDHEDH